MWRANRNALKWRRERQSRPDSLQNLAVEDISVQPARVEPLFAVRRPRAPVIPPTPIRNSVEQSPELGNSLACRNMGVVVNSLPPTDVSPAQELSPVPSRTDPPVVDLSEVNSESPCSSVVPAQQSSDLANCPPKSYLSLKLVKDSIPKFDGKSDSLINFIKQCKLINSKVKPNDRESLLFLIRGRIEGHAHLALSNRREVTTLDELIDLLKKIFAQSFNVHDMNAGLTNARQYIDEPVEVFGARINELLNSGLETARDAYNPEQLIGVNDLLKNTAKISFIKGLQNHTTRFSLNRLKDSGQLPDLETAITSASKIESELAEYSESPPVSSSRPVTTSAKIFKADFENRKCYYCNQTGTLTPRLS